jgi:hypothetical protein
VNGKRARTRRGKTTKVVCRLWTTKVKLIRAATIHKVAAQNVAMTRETTIAAILNVGGIRRGRPNVTRRRNASVAIHRRNENATRRHADVSRRREEIANVRQRGVTTLARTATATVTAIVGEVLIVVMDVIVRRREATVQRQTTVLRRRRQPAWQHRHRKHRQQNARLFRLKI